tara:strand:+ start:5341 stop:5829 length:489 start_codon:yes stop_codon:yes gene_type:complete
MIDKLKKIKLIGFDVDGVFTDGKIYINENGEESKAFHTQDGQGIRQLLDTGIRVIVISGRKSKAAEKRMIELGVEDYFLGYREKKDIFLKKIKDYKIKPTECAFVGDDISDRDVLDIVGFPIVVSNGRDEIKKSASYITHKNGGNGAIREISDLIINSKDKE